MGPDGFDGPASSVPRRQSLRSLARTVLDRILAGERAARAIDHPLDFTCIPLVRRPRFGLCGHIWSNPDAARTIHSHSWQLYSEIVLGAITNEVFRVAGQPGGDHQLIQVRSHGLSDQLVATGTSVQVCREKSWVHRGGDCYTLDANIFHRSTLLTAGPTLTLVKATMHPGFHDQIVVRPPIRIGATTRRNILPDNTALTMVALFRDAIESEPSNAD